LKLIALEEAASQWAEKLIFVQTDPKRLQQRG